MAFRTEFLDFVCQSKRLWLPLFYIDAILLVLGVVSYVSTEPGSAERVISVAGLVMIGLPFVCMVWLLGVCKERSG